MESLTKGAGDVSMCMRCGLRKPPRNSEQGCTCRERKQKCIESGQHGSSVHAAADALFPDYIHRTCLLCGGSVEETGT